MKSSLTFVGKVTFVTFVLKGIHIVAKCCKTHCYFLQFLGSIAVSKILFEQFCGVVPVQCTVLLSCIYRNFKLHFQGEFPPSDSEQGHIYIPLRK